MRRVRYMVVASLDGYIAGPNGEYDWIVANPELDFATLLNQFDTLLVGRRTFETMENANRVSMPGMKTLVFSRTLRETKYSDVSIASEEPQKEIGKLQASSGKDLWLFGGGELFSSLANQGLVNTVEITLMPILLGKGIPLAPSLTKRVHLKQINHTLYKAGIVSLQYECVA